ncbi:hypothetical protein QBC43DRAFT_297058 [Cladorrhinum sp. PSN259]|nr:hypothetical protein QBC43DRAFT_297058 [Cladorrhinum sp. PSN259]
MPTQKRDNESHPHHEGGQVFKIAALPAEIRAHILQLVLTAKKALTPTIPARVRTLVPWQVPTRRINPLHRGVVQGLALSNKALSNEAMHTLYTNNNFKLSVSVPTDRGFLNQIGRLNSSCIRTLTILCDTNPTSVKVNLVAMQNTITKRYRALVHVHYHFYPPISASAGINLLTCPEIRGSWRKLKAFKTITVYVMPDNNQNHLDSTGYMKLQEQSGIYVIGKISDFIHVGQGYIFEQWFPNSA